MSLIIRRHEQDGTRSEAVYSPCDRYRYVLSRTWDENGPCLLYIMLNPSKATEVSNDPTIERCERRARRLGYGGFGVCNLFAWRETDPKLLRAADEPFGPDNESQVRAAVNRCDHVLCAWGVHGEHRQADQRMVDLLAKSSKPLFTLGLSKDGHPRHPLYIPYERAMTAWSPVIQVRI